MVVVCERVVLLRVVVVEEDDLRVVVLLDEALLVVCCPPNWSSGPPGAGARPVFNNTGSNKPAGVTGGREPGGIALGDDLPRGAAGLGELPPGGMVRPPTGPRGEMPGFPGVAAGGEAGRGGGTELGGDPPPLPPPKLAGSEHWGR